jgi:hypothetical protein
LKDQLKALLELQELDLKIDKVAKEKKELALGIMTAQQVLKKLTDDLSQKQAVLNDTVELHSDKSKDLETAQGRLKDSKNRLTKVSNTKEYSAIEIEMENVSRQIGQLEDELIQLLEAIEVSKASIEEKNEKMGALSEQVEMEKQRVIERTETLEKEEKKVTKKREKTSKVVKKDLLRKYSFIRERRSGVAVVSAEQGSCSGCFMQLPPQAFIEIKRGNSLNMCPSCQRILFCD